MPRPPTDDEFTAFVHASWPSLYRTAYLLLGEHALAEDLVQASLAKTYASWGKVRDLSAAPGYARTVLVNTAARGFAPRAGATSWPPRSYRSRRTTMTPRTARRSWTPCAAWPRVSVR